MTTNRLLVCGLSAVLVVLLIWQGPLLSGETPAAIQPVRWVEVSSVGDEVAGMKKEITIDAVTAAKLFVKGFSRLCEGWEKNIPGKVENTPDARSIPGDVQKVWIAARDTSPYATVHKFSEKELIVLVLEHKGSFVSLRYYECKARLRLPRGKEVDAVFNVPLLEKTYGAMHKGLKQGDPVSEVTRKLGEPNARISYQLVDFYQLCYFKDNVIITINTGRVERFEFEVPQSLKDEVKKNGPNLIRY